MGLLKGFFFSSVKHFVQDVSIVRSRLGVLRSVRSLPEDTHKILLEE